MIMSSLLQSQRIACSFTVFPQCQNPSPQLPTVPIQQLPQYNRLLVLCEFENCAVTSDAIEHPCAVISVPKNLFYFLIQLSKYNSCFNCCFSCATENNLRCNSSFSFLIICNFQFLGLSWGGSLSVHSSHEVCRGNSFYIANFVSLKQSVTSYLTRHFSIEFVHLPVVRNCAVMLTEIPWSKW